MPVNIGDRLGHYHVTALLGQGMMGQVFRATDTRLNRDVALKILPETLATDPDRLARFHREAQVLASLNHPGIAAIYGLEEFESSTGPGRGTVALVLELVEGPTLATRIERGAIPLDEALPIATQIADAIEAAHGAGVIHRDLKPANIKVKDDGTVKVLDFGLAKALDTRPEAESSRSPVMTAAETQYGLVMGSPAYMSPEQARGRPVDKRTDIWAFGAVLYEMLTGRRAFNAEDVTLTLAEVIKSDPPFDALPSDIPPPLRAVLKRCLEKDVTRRLRDIGDVFLGIEEGDAGSAGAGPARWRERVVWGAALVAAVVVTWLLLGRSPSTVPGPEAVRFEVGLPSGQALPLETDNSILALSADARQLVYVGRGENGIDRLYHRAIGTLDAVPIPGTEGAFAPFLSPDGEWAGFVVGASLRKVRLSGGPAVEIAVLERRPISPQWGPNDVVYFGSPISGLYQVPATGGTATVLTELDTGAGEQGHLSPDVSADGRLVFYTLWYGSLDTGRIGAVVLDTGEQLSLADGVVPRASPDGHVVFGGQGDGTLWRMQVDRDGLDMSGGALPVLAGVSSSLNGVPHFDIASDGTLTYVRGPGFGAADRTLVWVDRQGLEQPITVTPASYGGPRLSPEGDRVVVQTTAFGVGTDLWVIDLDRGVRSPLTTGDAVEQDGLWTPDGRQVVFASDQDGAPALYVKAADGTGPSTLLMTYEDATVLEPFGWSADGSRVIFSYAGPDGPGLGALPLRGGTEWEPLVSPALRVLFPAISPDGRWIAYVADDTGNMEVYVQRFPEGGARQQVSNDGGFAPQWSANRDELFYVRKTAQASRGDAMMAVSVDADRDLVLGTPAALFSTNHVLPLGGLANYAVTRDGRRFLLVRDGAQQSTSGPTRLVAVLDWFSDLDR